MTLFSFIATERFAPVLSPPMIYVSIPLGEELLFEFVCIDMNIDALFLLA